MKKGVDYTGVCVCYFCHDGKGNFVMSHRNEKTRDEHNLWDIGGGGVEFGDRIEDVLRREIKEEYCADVLESEFLGFRDVLREIGGVRTHWIALDFKVLVDRNKVKNGEPDKFRGIRWFTLEKLPRNIHSQLPTFLEKYKDSLK